MENIHTKKRIGLLLLISLLVVSTLSQLSPVNAQTPEAMFTGAITDAGVDTDDDGLFDYLEIGVHVNVTSPGTFEVEVLGLYDSAFSYIDVSNRIPVDLDLGIQVVDVRLNGEEIQNFGSTLYAVAAVYIYTDSGNDEIDSTFDLILSREYEFTEFEAPTLLVDYQFDAINREIALDHGGSIHVTDVHSITNSGDEIDTMKLSFNEDAYDIEVRDGMGNLDVSVGNETLTVNLRGTVFTNEKINLYLNYDLPLESYITQQNGQDYKLHFTFYEEINYTIEDLTVSVKLPEGAEFQSSMPIDPQSTEKNGFQDTVTFTFSDVTPSKDLNFEINYRYLLFWSSFYPIIWVGALVLIVSVVAILWKIPEPSAVMIVRGPPVDLKNFVDAYEKKTRIKLEVESMESRLRKGNISRRRFKVRKKLLDGRLYAISRDLWSIHDKIRVAGPKYANMMRQIEVAETNLEGAEMDIQRVKARYKRGELSKGAYRKLMDEYKRRSETAEATIDGVILRLKEELR